MRLRRVRPVAVAAVVALAAVSMRPALRADLDLDRFPGMFALYEANRDQAKPNYITVDFLLLAYSMLVENAAMQMEDALAADVRALLDGTATRLAAMSAEDAAVSGARDYIAVLRALAAGSAEVPGGAARPDAVGRELALVRGAAGPAESPLFEQAIDYSQFLPRGRYARTPAASQYFQAMRYAGTVPFPLRASEATGITDADADRLTAQALTISRVISKTGDLRKRFDRIARDLAWFAGPADDLTVTDYAPHADANSSSRMAQTRARMTRAFDGRAPLVIGGAIALDKVEAGLTPADVLLGWRLFPLRITPDAPAMQALVYGGTPALTYKGTATPRSVGTIGGRPVKVFPLAEELMAILGSEEAGARLDATDDRNYESYSKAAAAAKDVLSEGEPSLPASHVDLLRRMLASRVSEPAVRLTRALGFWTLHRHVFVLTAKQSYTGVEKSLTFDEAREAGWLEPDVETLTALRATARELQRRLPGDLGQPFAEFGALLDKCVSLAREQLSGKVPKADARRFLNDLDRALSDLTRRADAPLVVDVHTDASSGRVLQEALAWPSVVSALIPSGKEPAVGARFAHREFTRPLSARLTDEAWEKELLAAAAKESR